MAEVDGFERTELSEAEMCRLADEDMKKRELLDLLNAAYSMCEPVKYEDFNKFIKCNDDAALEELEQNDNRIGIVGSIKDQATPLGLTTLSLIATITDVLMGKRLGVAINDDGYIMEFVFVAQP